MPRPKSQSIDQVIAKAMNLFWQRGYEALSMDVLVKVTGSSRHAIYADFGGKRDLFLTCLDHYSAHVITPAFAPVEIKGVGLEALEVYFERQIAFAEGVGLPGPGCLMANTMTELAPHDPEVMAHVNAHNQRLQAGFENVLQRMNKDARKRSRSELKELASVLAIAIQGLWSASRATENVEILRSYASNLVYFVEAELNR
ncbi:MAG: TetR/AcrR family transcriptional regulator [Hyphomicrobiales bacterium]